MPTRGGQPQVVLHDAMKKAMQKSSVAQKGLGFHGLRRSFETIGAETGDQVAVDHIMGHAPLTKDMGAVYRPHVAESALRQVTDHVHTWLFGPARGKWPTAASVRSTRGSTAVTFSTMSAAV